VRRILIDAIIGIFCFPLIIFILINFFISAPRNGWFIVQTRVISRPLFRPPPFPDFLWSVGLHAGL
jgi:hypothetical protein